MIEDRLGQLLNEVKETEDRQQKTLDGIAARMDALDKGIEQLRNDIALLAAAVRNDLHPDHHRIIGTTA